MDDCCVAAPCGVPTVRVVLTDWAIAPVPIALPRGNASELAATVDFAARDLLSPLRTPLIGIGVGGQGIDQLHPGADRDFHAVDLDLLGPVHHRLPPGAGRLKADEQDQVLRLRRQELQVMEDAPGLARGGRPSCPPRRVFDHFFLL